MLHHVNVTFAPSPPISMLEKTLGCFIPAGGYQPRLWISWPCASLQHWYGEERGWPTYWCKINMIFGCYMFPFCSTAHWHLLACVTCRYRQNHWNNFWTFDHHSWSCIRKQDTEQKDTGPRTKDTGQRAQEAKGHRTKDTGQKTQDTGHSTQDTGHKTQGTRPRTLGIVKIAADWTRTLDTLRPWVW